MNSCQINLKNIEKMNKLGNGSFAEVFRVKKTNKKPNTILAAKYYLNSTDSKEFENILETEIKVLHKMRHPAIIKYYGFSPINEQNDPKPVIFTEFVSNGSLDDLISKAISSLAPHEYDNTQKLIILYGIAAGMAYLHSQGIIHRDLKPGNVLLDSDYYPKICDFGTSKMQSNESIKSTIGLKGTPLYLSPESIYDNIYTKEGDVYSFAILAYEVITNTHPFPKLDTPLKIFNAVVSGERPEFDVQVDDAYRDLIVSCWAQSPSERPSFDEIKEKLENDSDFHKDIEMDRFLDYVDLINQKKVKINEEDNDAENKEGKKKYRGKRGRKKGKKQTSQNDDFDENEEDNDEAEEVQNKKRPSKPNQNRKQPMKPSNSRQKQTTHDDDSDENEEDNDEAEEVQNKKRPSKPNSNRKQPMKPSNSKQKQTSSDDDFDENEEDNDEAEEVQNKKRPSKPNQNRKQPNKLPNSRQKHTSSDDDFDENEEDNDEAEEVQNKKRPPKPNTNKKQPMKPSNSRQKQTTHDDDFDENEEDNDEAEEVQNKKRPSKPNTNKKQPMKPSNSKQKHTSSDDDFDENEEDNDEAEEVHNKKRPSKPNQNRKQPNKLPNSRQKHTSQNDEGSNTKKPRQAPNQKQPLRKAASSYNQSQQTNPYFKPMNDTINISKLKRPNLFKFNHDEYQSRSIYRIDQKDSVFVTSPPSTGKTTIAYYAIMHSLSQNKRVIYTTPLDAHLYQQYEDFSNFEIFNGDVGIKTNKGKNTKASILVASVKSLEIILSNKNDDDYLETVDTIIFDDFHLINIHKESFNHLIYLIPKNVQIVILSEPLSHLKYITNTISRVTKRNIYLEINDNRSIPLKHMIYHSGWMYTLADSEKKEPNNKALTFYDAEYKTANSRVGTVSINEAKYWPFFLGKLKELSYLPALIYTSSAEVCDELAQYCVKVRLLTPPEYSKVNQICENAMNTLPENVTSSNQIVTLFNLFKCGIAVLHDDIFSDLKKLIDSLFHSGLIKAIFYYQKARFLPAQSFRTVCFTQLYNNRTLKISSNDYIQMASIAGRRGTDDKAGFSIICMDKKILPSNILHDLIYQPIENAKRNLRIDIDRNNNRNSAKNKNDHHNKFSKIKKIKSGPIKKKQDIKKSSDDDDDDDDDDDGFTSKDLKKQSQSKTKKIVIKKDVTDSDDDDDNIEIEEEDIDENEEDVDENEEDVDDNKEDESEDDNTDSDGDDDFY